MKNLQQMSYDELVREGAEIRDQVTTISTRLIEVYRTLYDKVRRQPATDNTASYVLLANMGLRFSSLIQQAAKRVSPLEKKVVGLTDRKRREVELEEQRILDDLKKRDQKKVTDPPSAQLSDDDFLNLYGEDFE